MCSAARSPDSCSKPMHSKSPPQALDGLRSYLPYPSSCSPSNVNGTAGNLLPVVSLRVAKGRLHLLEPMHVGIAYWQRSDGSERLVTMLKTAVIQLVAKR